MAKNTAPVNTPNTSSAPEDEWIDQNLGFPPYWDPEEGDSVQCQIQSLDVRDPNFPRYICVYTGNDILICSKGAKDTDAYEEKVPVYPGEQFSMSEWTGIARDRLVYYIGLDIRLTRGPTTKVKPGEDGQPRKFINWKLQIKKSDQLLIETRRKEAAQLQAKNITDQNAAVG